MGDTKSKPWRVQKHTLCETHLSRHIFLQLLRPCFQDSFQDSQAPNASCMLPDSRCRHTNVVRDQETDQRDLLQSGRGSTAGIYLDLDFSLSHWRLHPHILSRSSLVIKQNCSFLWSPACWGWNVTQPSARHPALGLVDCLSWKTSGSPHINSSGFIEGCSKFRLLQIEWGVDLEKDTKPMIRVLSISNLASLGFSLLGQVAAASPVWQEAPGKQMRLLGTRVCRKSDQGIWLPWNTQKSQEVPEGWWNTTFVDPDGHDNSINVQILLSLTHCPWRR